ncbi:MAG TPA: hypothetical protein VFK59_10845 [Actinomycetota bacterium]|nr:hypothetical protein [Actinomycetota bacterium]
MNAANVMTKGPTRIKVAVAALVLSLAVGVSPASATPAEPCSLGDAREQFETFPLTFEGIPPCQYRLFFDGQTFTFGEDDYFLGGVVSLADYDPSLEGSRDAAIALLEAETLQTWIAEVTASGIGELVEQPLMRTALKSGSNDQSGSYVWVQWGLITRLPPGEYVSVTESSSPTFGDETWTVHLIITEEVS